MSKEKVKIDLCIGKETETIINKTLGKEFIKDVTALYKYDQGNKEGTRGFKLGTFMGSVCTLVVLIGMWAAVNYGLIGTWSEIIELYHNGSILIPILSSAFKIVCGILFAICTGCSLLEIWDVFDNFNDERRISKILEGDITYLEELREFNNRISQRVREGRCYDIPACTETVSRYGINSFNPTEMNIVGSLSSMDKKYLGHMIRIFSDQYGQGSKLVASYTRSKNRVIIKFE